MQLFYSKIFFIEIKIIKLAVIYTKKGGLFFLFMHHKNNKKQTCAYKHQQSFYNFKKYLNNYININNP